MRDPLTSETTSSEFKSSVERSKPKSWLKSVSAFANTKGGALVFGIADKTHEVVGVNDVQAETEFVSQAIRDRIDPVPPFEVSVEAEGGRSILVVTVPEGGDTPYYCHADGRMEAFVRLGSSSVAADAAQLRDLVLKGSNRTWDALDSGISASRASFTVLRAGLAKDEFEDTDEYEGGLLTLLRETTAFVNRHTVESWEKTDDNRIERRSYSARAVEEAVANALIHRSYLELGSEVQVDMYDDRMTIYSPGGKVGKPLPEDVATQPVASKRRNPVVADVFHRLHYMERRGSGLRKICEATAAEDAYRPEFKPIFETDEHEFRVTLWNMTYRKTDPVSAQVGTQVGTQVSTQVKAVVAAVGDEELTAAEIMAALGFSERSTFRKNYLKPALEAGAIERTIPDKPNSRLQRYRRARR